MRSRGKKNDYGGTGVPPVQGNEAVEDDRIAAVGLDATEFGEVIDVDGIG